MRHEGHVAGAAGHCVGDLAGIVEHLHLEQQLQRVGQVAQQIDGDAAHGTRVVPDGEKRGCSRRGHDTAAQLTSGRKLSESLGAGHAPRL
jgi:hypothetical protein